MALYDYKGITSEENKYAEGSIEAINEDEAAFKLKEKKVIITSLSISKGQKKTPKDKKTSAGLFGGGELKKKK